MEQLSFIYPSWLILICIIGGLGYTALLYYRSKAFADQPLWLRLLLAFMRFTVVTLLAILLLKPFFKQTTEEVQKPIIAILQDNSESVKLKTDSTVLESIQKDLDRLGKSWGEEAEVKWLNFGGSVKNNDDESLDFSEDNTDIASALEYIDDTYAGINLGAVVMVSDGIFNTGRHPLYTNLALKSPVYTIAVGDTSLGKDLSLLNTFANKISYLGDQVEIQVDVKASNLQDETTSIRITDLNGNSPAAESQVFPINSNIAFKTFSFIVEPNSAGVARYRISANPVSGEEDRRNNYRDVYIEVLDSRQKVLVLADAPHPDLAALSSLMSLKKTKEVEMQLAKDFKGNYNGYDLVIFHQIPGNDPNGVKLIRQWNESRVPGFFVLGSQSNINRFNGVQSVMEIDGANGQMNEVQPYREESFSLFSVDQSIVNMLPLFPPIYSPFGDYKINAGAQTLLSQKIGDVESGYPLLAFGESNGRKIGILTAEGIWRWRLFNYLEKDNFNSTGDLLEKITQYVSVKSDKRRFRLDAKKNVYNTNESIEFSAELYNAAYERINDPDVELKIRDEEGNLYDYVFNKNGNFYRLDAGRFEDGTYRYTATVNLEGEPQNISGSFSVEPIQLESFQTSADHNLLRLLSQKYNGEMFYPGQLKQLEDLINESDALKPVYYSTTQNSPAIDLKGILFLLLALLSVEWFIRKYLGSY